MVYSTRRFVECCSVCHFVLVFFSPFSIAITSLGEERANLSAFCTFVRFVLVWICRFPLPLGVWEGLRFLLVALPGHIFLTFSLTLYFYCLLGKWVCIRGRSREQDIICISCQVGYKKLSLHGCIACCSVHFATYTIWLHMLSRLKSCS